MIMNGKLLQSLDDLLQCFSIDDLVACYYSGELFFFLQKIGEYDKLAKLQTISSNGHLTSRLYELFELNPEWTESEIRHRFS